MFSPKRFARVIALIALFALSAIAQNNISNTLKVEGLVTDRTGAAVIGAEVTLSSGEFTAKQKTDVEGRFAFASVPNASGKVTIRADGFATLSRDWSSSDPVIEVTLEPDPIAEQVTVTAARTETRVSDTAASILVLTKEDLAATAALTIDDALRQAVGFTLFRRSGSRTSNPTTQGVSLRGVGASGASRAVVLEDGIPINDPFGAWINWGRIPREMIGRVEILRGGASNLYGSDGLGGAINILPRDPRDLDFSVEASYGNQQTPDLSFYGGGRVGQLGGRISGEIFNTEGYRLVDEDERGLVDTQAGSRFSTLDILLERLFEDNLRMFVNGSIFGESRENGTPVQKNRTHIRQLVLGADWKPAGAGSFMFRAFGSTQVFDQDFSAIAADRNSESITRSQRVPVQQIGFSAQWSNADVARQTLVAGFDAREVRGASDELGFFAGNITSATGSGGRELILGVFAQDVIRITRRWIATVGGRVDHWKNHDALSTSRSFTQPVPPTVTLFPDRTETAFSPRASILHKLTDNISLSASGYRAFRAPTLNELYRSFRVGNILTLANEDLRAERLTGGEAGASIAAFNRKLVVNGMFFWSEVARTVANVTLNVAPDLITRRRENLGRTRSRGVEVEWDGRVSERFHLSGGYQFADATVLESPANRDLEGLWIPQIARHQMTFQGRYAHPSQLTVGIQGRAIGTQFDDDRNQFKLDPFFTLDAFASKPINSNVEIFAAAENLTGARYDIGRTPVRTIGPPVLVRVGVRFTLLPR